MQPIARLILLGSVIAFGTAAVVTHFDLTDVGLALFSGAILIEK